MQSKNLLWKLFPYSKKTSIFDSILNQPRTDEVQFDEQTRWRFWKIIENLGNLRDNISLSDLNLIDLFLVKISFDFRIFIIFVDNFDQIKVTDNILNPLSLVTWCGRKSNYSITYLNICHQFYKFGIGGITYWPMTFIYIDIYLPNISIIILFLSSLYPFMSFSIVWGVPNIILNLSYNCSRFLAASCPLTYKIISFGMSYLMWMRADTCWRTRGRVGARNITFLSGNQFMKFDISTAAMWVFPRPVGRQTRVF